MEQEKLYVIEEKTYEAHIDEEVHLYGLLHQLAFLAGKIKDRRDMENLIDTARRYGEIADQMFDRWSIPGRYLVFGDKADLARLKALELCELDAFYVDCEDDEDQPHAWPPHPCQPVFRHRRAGPCGGGGGLLHRLSMRVGGLSLFHPAKALAGCAEVPGHHHIHEGGVF